MALLVRLQESHHVLLGLLGETLVAEPIDSALDSLICFSFPYGNVCSAICLTRSTFLCRSNICFSKIVFRFFTDIDYAILKLNPDVLEKPFWELSII